MDKQSSKKPFFIMPEWAWAIVVGMFMLLLFLNHVIPGHAAVSDSVTPIPTSSIDPTDACLCVDVCGEDVALFTQNSADFYALRYAYQSDEITKEEFLAQAYFVRYGSAGSYDDFFRDVKISLIQLMGQFPGLFVVLFDDFAAAYPYHSLKEAIESVGCPILEDYSTVLYSSNRVLTYVYTPFINVPVWVWDSNIPTPTPAPDPESVFFKFSYEEGGSVNYRLVEISAIDFGFSVPLDRINSSFLNQVASNHGVQLESVSGASFVMRSGNSGYNIATTGKNAFWVYFTAESVNYIKIYSIPDLVSFAKDPSELIDTFTGSDISQYPNYFCQFASPTVSNVFGLVFSQAKVSTPNWIASYSLGDVYGFDYVLQSISSTTTFLAEGNYYSNSESSFATWTIAYDGLFGLLGSLQPEPNPNGPTPTLAPTSTPVPLPTSGESIHVILPTGTPSPTPPFTVPGGSDGSSGSDSPGSIGSGLSSGQTSGVLQAWNLYVSDNPAMLFLTSTFQSLPPELLYPLYILLFILLLLAVIRLFVHFSGG